MSRRRCDTCQWAEVLPEQIRGYAVCRRHPPVAAVVRDEPEKDITGIAFPIWPIVWPQDWCAEHQPRGRGGDGEVIPLQGAA